MAGRTSLTRLALVVAVAVSGGSAVAVSRGAVVAVSRGSVLAPAGAAARDPTTTAGRRCGPIRWRSIRDGDQICPRSHSLLAAVSLTHLRWSSWSARGAVARGVQLARDTPPCPGSCDVTAPARVTLSAPIRCPGGARIYSRISEVIYGRGPAHRLPPPLAQVAKLHPTSRAHWSYDCAGHGGAGGG